MIKTNHHDPNYDWNILLCTRIFMISLSCNNYFELLPIEICSDIPVITICYNHINSITWSNYRDERRRNLLTYFMCLKIITLDY